jgi:hypothetical protein
MSRSTEHASSAACAERINSKAVQHIAFCASGTVTWTCVKCCRIPHQRACPCAVVSFVCCSASSIFIDMLLLNFAAYTGDERKGPDAAAGHST